MAKFLIGLLTGVILASPVRRRSLSSQLARFGTEKRVRCRITPPCFSGWKGTSPSGRPLEFPIPFFDQQTASTVKDVWDLLRKAAVDSRIKAVVFEPRNIDAGWGKLEEIHADLEQFRKSGKPLVAYLKGAGHPRILPGHRGRPHLHGAGRVSECEGTSRHDDVLQRHARQAGRAGGGRARGQVQGLRRHVRAHGHEPGDQRSHQQRSRRCLWPPGFDDRDRAARNRGGDSSHHRRRSVPGQTGGRQRA